MTTLAVQDLARLDLNLLLALHALLEERHVTRAASRLGSTQPSVSRALARLRTWFHDPLLVGERGHFQLTERARTLAPRVAEVLRSIQSLTQSDVFDPARATGTVSFAAPDIVSLMLVPPLLSILRERAPGLDLRVEQWQPTWKQRLESGELELTVGFPKGDESHLFARPLFEQDWAVVLRNDHPILRKRWTPALYASLDHVLVTLSAPRPAHVDDAFSQANLKRRVAVRVPYPLLAPMLALDTQLVVTTVRWLALRLAAQSALVVRKPPIDIPRARVPMVWHERAQHDPRQRWFRERVLEAAESITPSLLRWSS